MTSILFPLSYAPLNNKSRKQTPMATNKFATMLHRNTHKMTVILVYAFLEWVLIFLLLLNSLFSYLITKFANYFGLKPPCQWCSRVDHLLEPNKSINSYTDLVCEAHAMEISTLGHQKLAESENMCTSGSPLKQMYNGKSVDISPNITIFTWVSEKTVDHECSCCDEKLSNKVLPSYLMLKPSWEVLEYTQKQNLIVEEVDSENNGFECLDISQSGVQTCCRDDESLELMNLTSWGSDLCDFGRLIPVDLIDSSTIGSQTHGEENVVGNFVSENWIEAQVELVKEDKCVFFEESLRTVHGREANSRHVGQEGSENGKIDNFSVVADEQEIQCLIGCENTEAAQSPTDNNVEDQTRKAIEEEEDCKSLGDEVASEIVTSANVSGHELPIQDKAEESSPPLPYLLVDKSFVEIEESRITTGLDESLVEKNHGPNQFDKAIIGEGLLMTSANHEVENNNLSEPKGVKEKKFTFAPTDMDGSVTNEMDGDDGGFTVERLRLDLEAERKALSALYAELEEERNAAAIATNQTLAMITRLQEEKAAMQMEALQYQRMMDEQSEYDQEALQLLNELMIKREKEKQELEKEVESYRKKLMDYETKENMMTMRRKSGSFKSRNSSATSSNAEDSEDQLIDLNRQESLECMNNLSTLDESLAEFEEERISILEELKALEEKLFTLADNDDEEHSFEHFTLDVKPIDNFTDDYCKVFDENYIFSSPEGLDISNEFSQDLNENQFPARKAMGSTAKRLLPLFDAIGIESEEEVNSHSIEMQNSSLDGLEMGKKKVFIEEEVDHVYERLLALEADREFLKHCVGSLKKGDKGMDLLQEILQHLRDLRTVELRVRNNGYGPLTCPST